MQNSYWQGETSPLNMRNLDSFFVQNAPRLSPDWSSHMLLSSPFKKADLTFFFFIFLFLFSELSE